MFFALVVYNILDAWQTIMLLSLGAVEINPIQNFFIEVSGTPFIIFCVKAIPITLLGILLVHHIKEKEVL